jgi:hypothetical protein
MPDALAVDNNWNLLAVCYVFPFVAILLVKSLRFEIVTADAVRSTVSWDVRPYNPNSTDVSDEHITSIFNAKNKLSKNPVKGGQ